MKVKYIGPTVSLCLTNSKAYDVLAVSKTSGWYRVVDDTGEDYLYAPEDFEVLAKEPVPPLET